LVRLEGIALHSGERTAVTLSRSPGPLVLAQAGAVARLCDLTVIRSDRGVCLASVDGRIRVDLVEHLLAAFGGLGVRDGVRVDVVGSELPLLDGGAETLARAVLTLDAPSAPPRLTIARAAELRHERSTYWLAPGADVSLSVTIDFRAPIGQQRAAWGGDARDFLHRIAPARTFGFLDEHEALLARGRARGVNPEHVLVFDAKGPPPGCRAAEADEPARHKLLDLIGDLALYGGPPRGSIAADRPGHSASHAIVREALEMGVLA
jgi:UDP-3-O-[3-hydroxymyristoyl] N-acetylglucosamine deacetylase